MRIVREAQRSDRHQLVEMRVALWPESTVEEQTQELDAMLSTGMSGTLPGVILVSQEGDGSLIGFVEVGLRSHADGCDTERPVGFLEGWFVREQYRNQGVGKELVNAAEAWARSLGCLEMASDTQVDNVESQVVHQALGFEIADRCVHFRKAL